ncbi:MAG: DUF1206 domain-containing protein [Chitinophagaceae bacterium]
MNTSITAMDRLARIGLVTKGIVYLAIGALAFMAAFRIGGQKENEADRTGALELFEKTGGIWLLGLIAAGLICYALWRVIQAASGRGNSNSYKKRLRYFLSGLGYASIAITAIRIILKQRKDDGDQNQQYAAELLSQPMGEWLVGIGALIFAAIGIYQVYYALSKKYKKHVDTLNLHSNTAFVLLRMGKIGYLARGIVWLILAFLLTRAAIYKNSYEAGGTGKAFEFVQDGFMGNYLLAAIGLGVAAYGIFAFTRARYERF